LPAPDLRADIEAVLIRELGAEDHQVRAALLELALGLCGTLRHRGLITGVAQDRGHAECEILLTLDDEDASLHGLSCSVLSGLGAMSAMVGDAAGAQVAAGSRRVGGTHPRQAHPRSKANDRR